MIIVRLLGGLGNQMFQYAFGRRLADSLGVPLKLDTTAFATFYTKRRYELGGWRIAEDFASQQEIDNAVRGRFPRLRAGAHRLVPSLPAQPRSLVRERGYAFDPAMLHLKDGAYLDGYWQSERYFDAATDRLRRELVPREPLPASAEALAARMSQGNSVSLHVRRGDYVHEPEVTRVHLTCDDAYYARCLSHIAAHVPDPQLYLFTDDPDWVREHMAFPLPATLVADACQVSDVQELWLMQCCRHHILANSSFSWWGAWLNPRPDKLVLTPERWFRDRGPEITAANRPAGWIAL